MSNLAEKGNAAYGLSRVYITQDARVSVEIDDQGDVQIRFGAHPEEMSVVMAVETADKMVAMVQSAIQDHWLVATESHKEPK